MCTAIHYKTTDHYFGRNLDLEYRYNEEVVITPRNFAFPFRALDEMKQHYAMIGMATVADDYPLYYEGTNEHGLSMAALNFPGNAFYFPTDLSKENVAPFELIPLILGICKNLEEAKKRLMKLNIAQIPFNEAYPLSPLHWILAYKDKSLVIEQTKDGLVIYDNPTGVLTNNPPFPYHLAHLPSYQHLSPKDPVNLFSADLDLQVYSHGMGAIGLPGDLSSPSRFIRAAFMRANSVATTDEECSVSQFFHILNSVAMTRGTVLVSNQYEITVYSCCCNTDKGIYYYTTYENSQVTAVNMFHTDLNCRHLHRFPLNNAANFAYSN